MSGTLDPTLPLHALSSAPNSPLGALAAYYEAQKGGLANQGMALDNAQKGLSLGLNQAIMGASGIPVPGQSGFGQGGSALSGLMGASAMQAGGMPGGGGMMPGGAQGTAPQLPPPLGPNGALPGMFGMPVTPMQYLLSLGSHDKAGALAAFTKVNQQQVASQFGGLGSRPGAEDPGAQARWDQDARNVAVSLYKNQLIGPTGLQAIMRDPGHATVIAQSMADPDHQLTAALEAATHGIRIDPATGHPVADAGAIDAQSQLAGGKAGAEALARLGPETQLAKNKRQIETDSTLVAVPKQNADGTWSPNQVPLTDALKQAREGASPGEVGADGSPIAPGITPTKVFGALIGNEGSGPNSVSPKGARGTAQIVESTFNDYKLPGEKYSNEDDRVAAAHRYVDSMWKKYPGDAARVAVGYFSGEGNIAPANSPTPWVKDTNDGNMPVSEYVKRFSGRLGLPPTQVATNAAGVAPTATDAGGGAPAAAPRVGGGIVGPPVPTKVQEGVIAADNKRMDEDAPLIRDTQTAKIRANGSQTLLLDAKKRIDNAGSGAGAEWTSVLNNIIASYTPGKEWIKRVTGLDLNNVQDQQVLQKELINLLSGAEAQQPNTRWGAQLNAFFAKGSPSISQQPQTIHAMMNNMLVANQMIRDYGNDAAAHYNNARDTFQADPIKTRYQPMTKFDETWGTDKSLNSPTVYAAASAAINGKPYAEYTKGLSAQQVGSVLGIVSRADPAGARVLGPDGVWHVFNQPAGNGG